MKYLLIVMACAAGQPNDCVQEQFPLPEITNHTACYLGSRLRLREWLASHQDWQIKGAHCAQAPVFATASDAAAPMQDTAQPN